jgi:hypothetical protein
MKQQGAAGRQHQGAGLQRFFCAFPSVSRKRWRESRDCNGLVRGVVLPISGQTPPHLNYRRFRLPAPPQALTPVLPLLYSRPTKRLQKDRRPPFAPRAFLRRVSRAVSACHGDAWQFQYAARSGETAHAIAARCHNDGLESCCKPRQGPGPRSDLKPRGRRISFCSR